MQDTSGSVPALVFYSWHVFSRVPPDIQESAPSGLTPAPFLILNPGFGFIVASSLPVDIERSCDIRTGAFI